MPDITNIPAPRVPLIDERTGLISREWFRYLNNQFRLTGSGTTDASIADLELTPTSSTADTEVPLLQTEVAALKVAPPPAVTPFAGYGMFYDTTTQTAAAINTAYALTLDTTAYAYGGVRRGSPTSRVYCGTPGLYNFAFSLQLDKTLGGTASIWIWGRKNTTDIAWSASHFHIQGNTNEAFVAANFFVDMGVDDYFQLMWATNDTTAVVQASPAAAPIPAIPSVILTVNQVNI